MCMKCVWIAEPPQYYSSVPQYTVVEGGGNWRLACLLSQPLPYFRCEHRGLRIHIAIVATMYCYYLRSIDVSRFCKRKVVYL